MYSKQSLTSPQNKLPTSPTMQPQKATTLFTSQAMRTGFNFNSQKKLLNSPENGPIKPEALTLENIKFSNYKPSIAAFHTHNYSESPEEMKMRKKNSDLAVAKHSESNKPIQNKKSYEQPEDKHRLNIPLGMTHQKSQTELNSKTSEPQDMRNCHDLKSPPNDGQDMRRSNLAFQDIRKPTNEPQEMRKSQNELQDMKKHQNELQDMRRSPNQLQDMKRPPTEVIDMRRSNELQDMKRLPTEVIDIRRPPAQNDLQDIRRPPNEFQDVKRTPKQNEEEAKAIPFFEAKMKDSSKSVHSIDNNNNKKESSSPKEEPKIIMSGIRGRITKKGSLTVEDSPKNQELVVKNQDTGEVFLLNDMNTTPMNQEYLEKLKKRKKEEIWQDWWSDKRRINQELLGAVKSNNILLLEKLFDENVGDKKPEINCKDEKDWSCLHFACLAGNYGMALQLIKREAEIDPQTNLKQTPLIIAAQK